MIRAIGHCVNCGHPVAADGETLRGAAAEPREGARPTRCSDTACVCTSAPSRVDHWVEALRAAGLELRRTDGSEPERADYVRAFGVSTGVLYDVPAEECVVCGHRDGLRLACGQHIDFGSDD